MRIIERAETQGICVTVAHRTLTPFAGVRIPHPLPQKADHHPVVSFLFCRDRDSNIKIQPSGGRLDSQCGHWLIFCFRQSRKRRRIPHPLYRYRTGIEGSMFSAKPKTQTNPSSPLPIPAQASWETCFRQSRKCRRIPHPLYRYRHRHRGKYVFAKRKCRRIPHPLYQYRHRHRGRRVFGKAENADESLIPSTNTGTGIVEGVFSAKPKTQTNPSALPFAGGLEKILRFAQNDREAAVNRDVLGGQSRPPLLFGGTHRSRPTGANHRTPLILGRGFAIIGKNAER